MKLTDKEFARYKELSKRIKDLTEDEKAELAALVTKRKTKDNKNGTNDVGWWDKYPELSETVINLPFNWIPGTAVVKTNDTGSNYETNIPGVMLLRYVPTIGHCSNNSDPANAQFRQQWIALHRKYRGLGGYEMADLGITEFCIMNAMTTIMKFERIYGVINSYHIQNRNVPYVLKEALGIDDSIESDLANFRAGLNFRIAKIRQLCLPKDYSLLNAHGTLNTFIYKDGMSPKAGMFLYDPDIYYVYDATFSTGTRALGVQFDNNQTGTTAVMQNPAFTVNDIFQIIDDQINALLNDDDVNKICSDMLAAYGPENVISLTTIPDDYVVPMAYDEERLLQLHNTSIVGNVSSRFLGSNGYTSTDVATLFSRNTFIVIGQNNNVIQNELVCGERSNGQQLLGTNEWGFGWTTTPSEHPASDQLYFDVWKDKPSKADVLCGSRFMAMAGRRKVNSGVYYYYLDVFGSEVVTTVLLYTKSGNTYSAGYVKHNCIKMTASYLPTSAEFIAGITKFDWHPMIYYFTGTGQKCLVLGDLYNFDTLDDKDLEQIHYCALYSAFKCDLSIQSRD